jgi:hypothetical protein
MLKKNLCLIQRHVFYDFFQFLLHFILKFWDQTMINSTVSLSLCFFTAAIVVHMSSIFFIRFFLNNYLNFTSGCEGCQGEAEGFYENLFWWPEWTYPHYSFRYSTWFQWYKIFSMVEVGWYFITVCMTYLILKSLIGHQYRLNCSIIHKCGYDLGTNSGNHNLPQMIDIHLFDCAIPPGHWSLWCLSAKKKKEKDGK